MNIIHDALVGKGISDVLIQDNERGLCVSVLLRFSDGTEIQIGAMEDFVVFGELIRPE